jgi:pantothenate synthetase
LSDLKAAAGTMPVSELENAAITSLSKHPEFSVEYLTITCKDTLLPLDSWDQIGKAMALTAVKLNNIRLIDNVEFFM